MKIVLLGATGFGGSALLDEALHTGGLVARERRWNMLGMES